MTSSSPRIPAPFTGAPDATATSPASCAASTRAHRRRPGCRTASPPQACAPSPWPWTSPTTSCSTWASRCTPSTPASSPPPSSFVGRRTASASPSSMRSPAASTPRTWSSPTPRTVRAHGPWSWPVSSAGPSARSTPIPVTSSSRPPTSTRSAWPVPRDATSFPPSPPSATSAAWTPSWPPLPPSAPLTCSWSTAAAPPSPWPPTSTAPGSPSPSPCAPTPPSASPASPTEPIASPSCSPPSAAPWSAVAPPTTEPSC